MMFENDVLVWRGEEFASLLLKPPNCHQNATKYNQNTTKYNQNCTKYNQNLTKYNQNTTKYNQNTTKQKKSCRCEEYAISLLEQCEDLREVETFLQTRFVTVAL